MKQIFILFFAIVLFGCEKEKTQPSGEFTDVIYEIETSDAGFIYLNTVEYDLLNQTNPPTPVEWQVTSIGTFRKKVRIKRGFQAEITAAHPSSARWTLRIKDADGQLLASATPTFFPAPLNYFYAGFSVPVN